MINLKRALVLSGGGCKGAFEIGALRYLISQQRLDFDLFCGTSVGAINAAFLSQAADSADLEKRVNTLAAQWMSIKGWREIYRPNHFGVLSVLFGISLFKPLGLERLVHSLITPQSLTTGKTLLIPAVALEDGELYFADSRKEADRFVMSRFVLASASIPLYFPPVLIRGKHWVDGGLRDLTPLSAILKEEPREVYIITTYPVSENLEPIFAPFDRFNNSFAVTKRILDILTAEIGSNDLKQIHKTNQNFPPRFRLGNTRTILIAPEQPLSKGSMSFAPKLIRDYYQLGQTAAATPKVFSGPG